MASPMITAQEWGFWQTRMRAAKDREVAAADALWLVQTYPGLTWKILNCLQKSEMKMFLLGWVHNREMYGEKTWTLQSFRGSYMLGSSCPVFSCNCIRVPSSPCLTVWLFTRVPHYLARNRHWAPWWALTRCVPFGELSCFICTAQKSCSMHRLYRTRSVSRSRV